MSGTHVLPGAHHIALNDCTINAASTVRETTIIYLRSWWCGSLHAYRSTSITLGVEEHPTRSFPSCQTPVFDSQAEQKSLPNWRSISQTVPMINFRRESIFYCMEWVLERLKFAWSLLRKCQISEYPLIIIPNPCSWDSIPCQFFYCFLAWCIFCWHHHTGA